MATRLAEHREAAAARARGDKPKNFISTGIRSWDRNGGLETGFLTLIGAPTGEGKSALMLHLLKTAARSGVKCLALSFEDPPGKTADRVFSQSTGESGHVLGRMDYDSSLLVRMQTALDECAEWAENIDFQAGLVTAEQAMQVVKASDAMLIIVDYAQAFPDDEGTRERMLAKLSWDLSELAQRRSAAVILFSQIKREVEERGKSIYDKTGKIDGYRPGPGTGDIGWSAAMGQRAKVVIYLFRPGRWARAHGMDAKDNKMELIFAKVSFGVEGCLTVDWNGPTASISDPVAL